MTSDQFNHIWNQLDKNADGKVDYRDFLKRFSTRTDVIRAVSTTPPLRIRDIRVRRQTHSLQPSLIHSLPDTWAPLLNLKKTPN